MAATFCRVAYTRVYESLLRGGRRKIVPRASLESPRPAPPRPAPARTARTGECPALGASVRLGSRGTQRVQAAQDLHRLGAQRALHRGEVLGGQLAGAIVELGVADLAVLGLARGLELGAARRWSPAGARRDARRGALITTITAASTRTVGRRQTSTASRRSAAPSGAGETAFRTRDRARADAAGARRRVPARSRPGPR